MLPNKVTSILALNIARAQWSSDLVLVSKLVSCGSDSLAVLCHYLSVFSE